MKTTVTGAVLWNDNNQPVERARVDAVALESGRVLASSSVDAEGNFKLRVDTQQNGQSCSRGIFFVVTWRDIEQLLSTRDLPTALTCADMHVQLSVPSTGRPDERERRPVVRIGGFELDAALYAQAEPRLVLELARAIVDRDFEKQVRDRLAALSPAIVPSEHARRTLSNTPILALIDEIMERKQWPRALRLKVDDILRLRRTDTDWPDRPPGPEPGFTAQVHLCPNFRITYQDSGPAAVNLDTSAQDVFDPGNPTPTVLATLPAGGAPAYIKRICFWLERALAAYISPPFNLRNPAAGGRIDVVVNTASFGSAGASAFYINNNLPPDVLCAVAVHELFHMVHRLYAYSGTGSDWHQSSNEGGAVWAEDSAAEFLNRYLDEAGTNFNGAGYMVQPHVSLEGFSYKTSLFWRYIAEQQSALTGAADEPKIGVDVFREILERFEAGSWSANDLKSAIRNLPWYQDFYDFSYLDPGRRDLLNAETTFGNFALAAYLKDLGANVPDRRFDFMEDEENIAIDDVIATMIPSTPLQATLASVARAGTGTLTSSAAVSFSSNVPRFGSRYYEVMVDAGVTSVQLECTAGSGLTSVLFQAALIDEASQVREIYRSDSTGYSKRFPNLRDGKRLNRIAVVVSGCDTAGPFTVTLSPAAAASDVMVTRWHSVMKTEYEIDSRNWAWTWVSPDIYVDNDLDGLADVTVFFNMNNKLHIRLHNKGNQDANNIGVQFWYQDAAGGLSDAAWQPVRNTAGMIQSLSGLSLVAGASNAWHVDWSPVPSGASSHFCVRAVVTAPGDPNTDNKRVQSNFGNVVVAFRHATDLTLVRRHLDRELPRRVELLAVPRFERQFELAPRDLQEQRVKLLRPEESCIDELRIYHRPLSRIGNQTRRPNGRGKNADCPCSAPLPQNLQRPDPTGDYPADPRTLPPGVAGKPMVTLVYRADGQVIGGVTLMLSLEDGEHERTS
jgi:hypothetical protein